MITYLPTVFDHHIELLLAHPGLGFVRVEQVLLGLLPLGQVVLALLDGICAETRMSSKMKENLVLI